MKPDHRTLDEIYKDDTAMTMHKIERECMRYEFQTFTQARKFQRMLIDIAVKRLGVPPLDLLRFQKRVLTEKPVEMPKQQIRIENRTYAGQEKWKAGIYLYKMQADGNHGEIAYWVSNVFMLKENPILRPVNLLGLPNASRDNTGKYFVMSNVPKDDFNKHFMMLPQVG